MSAAETFAVAMKVFRWSGIKAFGITVLPPDIHGCIGVCLVFADTESAFEFSPETQILAVRTGPNETPGWTGGAA